MTVAPTPASRCLAILLIVVAAMLPRCSSSDPTGREWVNAGRSDKSVLLNGVLHIDKRFIPAVRRNYEGYIGLITKVFKDKHLFNLNPVPLVVYFMFDEAELK